MKNETRSKIAKLLLCFSIIIATIIVANNLPDVEAQSPTCGCPIGNSFTMLPQDQQHNFLEGGGVDAGNLNVELFDSFFNCLRVKPGFQNLQMETGYRTVEYQRHLFEVWTKRKRIEKGLTSKERDACGSFINEVHREFAHHGIVSAPAPPERPSSAHHTSGQAIDLAIKKSGISSAAVGRAASECGLCRPYPGDYVHFELKTFNPLCHRR